MPCDVDLTGSKNFANHDATLEQGKKYFDGFLGWACSQPFDSYYYTYFDHRWASQPDYEGHFGVVDADGVPKFGLSNGVC